MIDLYKDTIKHQRTAYLYLYDDYRWSKRSKTVNDEIAVMFGDKVISLENTFFITFNFDEKLFNSVLVIDRLINYFLNLGLIMVMVYLSIIQKLEVIPILCLSWLLISMVKKVNC